jgi:hypothetical protein
MQRYNLYHLETAAKKGHIKCIQYEFERASDFNFVYYYVCDFRLLNIAIKHLQPETVEFLLQLHEMVDSHYKNIKTNYHTNFQGYEDWKAEFDLERKTNGPRRQDIIASLEKRGLLSRQFAKDLDMPAEKRLKYTFGVQ